MLSPMMESLAHDCVLLESARVSDGEGGWTKAWTDGATFKTYPALDTSMQARIAEKDGVTSVYTVLVPQDVPIEAGDFYRDETAGGTTYHVTSNPDEKATPEMSALGVKAFTAEKKALPG